jgi:hypothetical protein
MGIPLVALMGQQPKITDYQTMQANAAGIQNMRGQNALQPGQLVQQQQQIELQRRQMADQDALTKTMQDWDGKDLMAIPSLVLKHGGSGQSAIALKSAFINQQKDLTGLNESQLTLADMKADHWTQALDDVAKAPEEQRAVLLEQAKANAVQKGWATPQEAQAVNYQNPQQFDALRKMAMGHKAAIAEVKAQAETAEASGKAAESQAKLPGEQAESTIKGVQAKMISGAQPGTFDTAIDQIAPPTGPNAALNARTKVMVNSALGRGDLEGAKKALTDASTQLGSLEKETSPQVLQFKAREAANSAAIQQAIKNGSAEDAGKMLAQRIVAPSEIAARSNPSFLVQANKAALKYDPTYSAEKADADFNVAKAPANVAFFGSANSLTNKGGTLDQLEAQYKKLPSAARKIPLFNTIGDYLSYHGGGPGMAGFMQTALAAADDYAKVVGGGVGTDTSRLQFMQTFSHAQSPEQFKASIDAARAGVGSQQDARIGSNPILKNMYGGGTAASRTTTGGAVKMKSPTGQIKEVPADQVDHYKSKGAVIVQ